MSKPPPMADIALNSQSSRVYGAPQVCYIFSFHKNFPRCPQTRTCTFKVAADNTGANSSICRSVEIKLAIRPDRLHI
eukprot:scaffold85939_cov31-Prasinocladus_malaysianus.AAC.1